MSMLPFCPVARLQLRYKLPSNRRSDQRCHGSCAGYRSGYRTYSQSSPSPSLPTRLADSLSVRLGELGQSLIGRNTSGIPARPDHPAASGRFRRHLRPNAKERGGKLNFSEDAADLVRRVHASSMAKCVYNVGRPDLEKSPRPVSK